MTLSEANRRRVAQAVLSRYPATYGEELGIRTVDTPSGSFRVLVMSLLFGARISTGIAVVAARDLAKQKWTTPSAMAAATPKARAHVLTEAGYAASADPTARALGDLAQAVLEEYGGDVRRIRDAAGKDPKKEARLLQALPGIGPVGVETFLREIQRGWDEVHPFADKKALAAAAMLELGSGSEDLAALCTAEEFPRLVSGLAQVEGQKTYVDVVTAALG